MSQVLFSFNAGRLRDDNDANDNWNDDFLGFGTELDVAFDSWRREQISRAPPSAPPVPRKRFEQFDLVMDNMMAQMALVESVRAANAPPAAAAPAPHQFRPPERLPAVDVVVAVAEPELLKPLPVPVADAEPVGAKRAIVPLTRQSPTWVRDAAAPLCFKCRTSFSFWTRRHHCRACGLVVCGACSARELPCVGGGRARVCNDCAVEEAASECIVCMSRPCDTLLLPCAHANYCGLCASQLLSCALCRGFIRTREYLFKFGCGGG
jgi:hypothetical protein